MYGVVFYFRTILILYVARSSVSWLMAQMISIKWATRKQRSSYKPFDRLQMRFLNRSPETGFDQFHDSIFPLFFMVSIINNPFNLCFVSHFVSMHHLSFSHIRITQLEMIIITQLVIQKQLAMFQGKRTIRAQRVARSLTRNRI